LDKTLGENLPLIQDFALKLRFATVAEIIEHEFVKEMFHNSSEEFKELLKNLSVGKIDVLEGILENYYKDMMMTTKHRKLEPELWIFFKAYPLIVNYLETLKSITLIINNQVLTLDINFPGLFTKFPKPTPQNLEDFNTLEIPPIWNELKE